MNHLDSSRHQECTPLALLPNSKNNPRGMNESPPVLSLVHVSRKLSGRMIVEDLDLNLERGEVLGLLGVNRKVFANASDWPRRLSTSHP